MRPSKLTRQHCAIYSLAFEFYTQGAKAMHHPNHAGVQRGRAQSDLDPKLAWAIDYISRIPPEGAELIDKAHSDRQLTPTESRRCGKYLKQFYVSLYESRLIGVGGRWLSIMGESEVYI